MDMTDRTEPDAAPSPPPLGISLSAFIMVGFMLMALLGGVSLVSRGVLGAGLLISAVSILLVWQGWLLYRCRFGAWLVAMATFSLLTAIWAAGAVVLGAAVALLYVPLFAAPIVLLVLPSSRAAVIQKR